MPRLSLVQGSEPWHEYRKTHIMATSASIILGTNPFKTPLELWEEMLGIREPVKLNDAMRRGNELEEPARQLFIKNTGIHMEPVVFESDLYPWMSASLDGLSTNGEYVLEIKSPGHNTHDEAIRGILKPYYVSQMQHQLLCTGAQICYYMSYRPEHEVSFIIHEVYPDPELHKIILEKEKAFYLQLCTMEEPKPWVLNG